MPGISPKHEIVLNVLRDQIEPISLSYLAANLPAPVSDRTLRRWLQDMADNGLVQKTGQNKGARYSEAHDTIDSSSEYLSKPVFERKPVSYNEAWLERYTPNKTYLLSESVRTELMNQGRREHQAIAGTFARKIYDRLLVDLSYNSSRLEGNTYSRADTEALVLHGKIADGKITEEQVMILNHKEAIRYLVDQGPNLSPSVEAIKTLHYLLSDGLLADRTHSGHVRNDWVRIGQSAYTPLDTNQQLEPLLAMICDKAAAIEHPIEQSFFLLMHLSYLQPFIDVNKRTSRLACNIPLVKENMAPLSFNDVDASVYITAILGVYELNDPTLLASLYREAYLRSCMSYDVQAQMIGINEVRIKYRSQRRDVLREILEHDLHDELQVSCIRRHLDSVDAGDHEAFIAEVNNDLHDQSLHWVNGLGVSKSDARQWQEKASER